MTIPSTTANGHLPDPTLPPSAFSLNPDQAGHATIPLSHRTLDEVAEHGLSEQDRAGGKAHIPIHAPTLLHSALIASLPDGIRWVDWQYMTTKLGVAIIAALPEVRELLALYRTGVSNSIRLLDEGAPLVKAGAIYSPGLLLRLQGVGQYRINVLGWVAEDLDWLSISLVAPVANLLTFALVAAYAQAPKFGNGALCAVCRDEIDAFRLEMHHLLSLYHTGYPHDGVTGAVRRNWTPFQPLVPSPSRYDRHAPRAQS